MTSLKLVVFRKTVKYIGIVIVFDFCVKKIKIYVLDTKSFFFWSLHVIHTTLLQWCVF